MGVVVSAQLAGYLTAAVLGLAAGAVYDLLRVVRLRRRRSRRLTHALDCLFVAALALTALTVLFLFEVVFPWANETWNLSGEATV